MAVGSHSWWLHLFAIHEGSFRLPSLSLIQKTQSDNQFNAVLPKILQSGVIWKIPSNSESYRVWVD